MSTLIRRAVAVVAAVGMCVVAFPAYASGPYDFDWSELVDFEIDEVDDQGRVWGSAEGDQDKFGEMTADLGQVFAPRLIAPTETLGQAGFAVKAMTSFSVIPNQEDHWQQMTGGDAQGALFSSHLQVRKGLPLSFEVAGNLSHLARSQQFVMGADLRWALHEGYRFFPDVGVRASANVLTGAPQLNLFNTGWDASISRSFGVGGVVELTPYLGYQQLFTFASTRVLNARPQDPRPPQTRTDDDQAYAPEFVFPDADVDDTMFGQQVHVGNRPFAGLRLNTWIMSFTFEAVLGDRVQQFSFAGGVDF